MEFTTMAAFGLSSTDRDRLTTIFADYLAGLDDDLDHETEEWIRIERVETIDLARRVGIDLTEHMTTRERAEYDHLDD